eukprot:CAMPEP_0180677158 /NCGR_PEP_ID=MMETSP1037_2-20121125/67701_1 /TAXON_ID=632150 /ORGANISM="Azadinium spinosum, Strain 3D9" /LENGTH=46 /DNA_ID= /DNA_START= /DNA_END= /DNA_ORIENTATION=
MASKIVSTTGTQSPTPSSTSKKLKREHAHQLFKTPPSAPKDSGKSS